MKPRRKTDPVRAHSLACLILLGGCGIIGNEPLRVESFALNPDGTFVFAAKTNTVMTENDDGEAEQIRRGWLAEELTEHDICGAGYVIETRRLTPLPEEPVSNAHNVVYTGRCL